MCFTHNPLLRFHFVRKMAKLCHDDFRANCLFDRRLECFDCTVATTRFSIWRRILNRDKNPLTLANLTLTPLASASKSSRGKYT